MRTEIQLAALYQPCGIKPNPSVLAYWRAWNQRKVDFSLGIQVDFRFAPGWRNRQTHRTQNPVDVLSKGRDIKGMQGEKSHTTLNPTLPDAKTSQIDAIREALAGLSRDELLAILADALAGQEGCGEE